MHRRSVALFILAPVALILAADSEPQFKYPPAPTSEQVDDYSGVKVGDPYRPLENPDAPESRKWIEAEDKITFDFLKTIPRQLILVDHNELPQAVNGADKVPIVEIIDHHRLGGFASDSGKGRGMWNERQRTR